MNNLKKKLKKNIKNGKYIRRGITIFLVVFAIFISTNYINNIYAQSENVKIKKYKVVENKNALNNEDLDDIDQKHFISKESRLKKINIPKNSGDGWFKSYMDPKTITSRGSKQYRFKSLYSCDKDGLYRYKKYYVVAVSEKIFKVGDRIKVEFDDGIKINCFVGDTKNKNDKNMRGIGHIYYFGNKRRSSIIEFMVNEKTLNSKSHRMGSVNNIISNGNVKSISIIK